MQSMRYHTRAKRRKEEAMDWRAIKTEYVTTDTSYRKLAKKYGIHHTAIAIRAGREGWVAERERFNNKTLSKTLNKLSSEQAGRAARLHRVADKLLSKIEKAVDALEDEALETQQYRQLTASLKDLKDIQMIKSEADIREQEARIANLKRQTAVVDDGNGKGYGVVLLPPIAEMPKPPDMEANDE